jgi:hypothetical protein
VRRALALVLLTTLASVSCHGDINFDEVMTTCTLDADCLLPSLHCSAGRCVACTSDAHCTAPGFPRCDLAMNRCVQCGATSDCADGATCYSGRCLAPCAAGCPLADPICDDQVCGECSDDDPTSCAGSAAGSVCFEHFCGACKDDSACAGATPRCDPVSHECVQCQQTSDCGSATPLCDPAKGRCVAPP